MKPSRIRGAFPWWTAALLALIPCLPLLTLWAWFRWELEPIQRYYLIDYWSSTERANQPASLTQIQWIYATAPGRTSQVLIEGDVTAGEEDGLPFQLSGYALQQGWNRVGKGTVQSYPSVKLEELLREEFYGGRAFHQMVTEPLIDGCAAWLILVIPMLSMRDELGAEWMRLRLAVSRPQWDSNWELVPDQRGMMARIRSLIGGRINGVKDRLSGARFMAAMRQLVTAIPSLKNVSVRYRRRRVSTGVKRERLTPLPLADPRALASPKAPP